MDIERTNIDQVHVVRFSGAMEAMGVTLYRVERAEDVTDTVNAAAAQAFNNQCSTAVLLSQRLIGAKGFK